MRSSIRCGVFILFISLLAPQLVEAQFTFNTNSDGSLNISQYTGTNNVVIIPSATNGLSITSIGSTAFKNCSSLTSITIPNSVTSIGNEAFLQCINLTSVTIGSSVTNIESYAFCECYDLTSIVIPASVTSIGDYAFAYIVNLTSVYFLGSAPSADTTVFTGDSTTVYYFRNTTGWGATFAGRPTAAQAYTYTINADGISLTITGYTGTNTVVVIPSSIDGFSVSDIGNGAFSEFLGNTASTSVTIPYGVTSIGSDAFDECMSLTNVTIPDSVTNIGSDVFEDCFSLTSVTIPASAANIANDTLGLCGLSAITVDTNNPVYSSVNGVLFDKNQTTLFQYPNGNTANSYTIPNTVTGIGAGAFYDNVFLNSVMIPNSVTSIGESAFMSCGNLSDITIPDSVTNIGGGAFEACGFSNVTIPNSVPTIGSFTFDDCGGLTNISLSSSVTSIGYAAFYSCGDLTSITIDGSVTNIGSYAFSHCFNLTNVYFTGNAPLPTNDSSVFQYDDNAIAFYLPGTADWGPTFDAIPTGLWLPQMQASGTSFGVQTNQFGFNINWASGQIIVVQACMNLANPVWQPVQTNTLTNGLFYFSDPQWTNYPSRFYRLFSP